MNRIERILCAVDFSQESHDAAEFAAALSRILGTPMVLFHSHHAPAMAAYGRATTPDRDVWIPGPADEQHELDLWVEELRAQGTAVSPLFVEGTAAAAFARTTESCDLLIIGTHMRGEIARALLGSSAERIVRSAHCPAIVLPAGCRHRALGTIVVATDFSEASRHALQAARDFARLAGARVQAVHVVLDEHVRTHEHYEVHEHIAGMIAAATADLARMLADAPEVPSAVRTGIPHDEIVKAAEAAGADLIAIGLHGHNPLAAAVLGSTANHVLRHAHCPVLVTR